MASKLKLILGVFFAIALAACGEYGKIYKSKDSQAKYKLAMSLYEEKNFAKAVPLFEQLRDAYRTTSTAWRTCTFAPPTPTST